MSVLTSVEPASLNELPSGLTEVYLDNLQDTINEVAKFPLHPDYVHLAHAGGSPANQEWC